MKKSKYRHDFNCFIVCMLVPCASWFNYYSGISIRRTHHKAEISIRRTVNLGTERFPGQAFIRKSL